MIGEKYMDQKISKMRAQREKLLGLWERRSEICFVGGVWGKTREFTMLKGRMVLLFIAAVCNVLIGFLTGNFVHRIDKETQK